MVAPWPSFFFLAELAFNFENLFHAIERRNFALFQFALQVSLFSLFFFSFVPCFWLYILVIDLGKRAFLERSFWVFHTICEYKTLVTFSSLWLDQHPSPEEEEHPFEFRVFSSDSHGCWGTEAGSYRSRTGLSPGTSYFVMFVLQRGYIYVYFVCFPLVMVVSALRWYLSFPRVFQRPSRLWFRTTTQVCVFLFDRLELCV